MNLTIYNPKDRTQKYTIRYRATHDKVEEGVFTVQDENNIAIYLDEESLFTAIKGIVQCTTTK